MEYIDYGEVSGYEIEVENENITMIYGYNREAKINEYHWATSKVECLIEYLKDKKDFLITFIPNEWVITLEKVGFVIRNAWHDYFMNELEETNYSGDYDFLTAKRILGIESLYKNLGGEYYDVFRK